MLGRSMASVPFTLLLVFALCGQAGSEPYAKIDFRAPPEDLPYSFELRDVNGVDSWTDNGMVRGAVFLDLDGDGGEEQLIARNPGIHASRNNLADSAELWQHNLPPSHSWRTPCASIEGMWDIDGDGAGEVVLLCSRSDGTDWRIRALAAADGRLVDEIILPDGVDNRPDGRIDTHYKVLGMIDVPSAGRTVKAYAVLADSGFDLEPRGIMAAAPGRGADCVLWKFLLGAKPDFINTDLVDLENDGRQEIVFSGIAVNNLGGRIIGGFSDDVGVVIALENDGSLRWSHELFRGTCGAAVATEDLDGDGIREVVVASALAAETGNVLRVLSGADAKVLAEVPIELGARAAAACPAGDGGPAAIYIASSFGRSIQKFTLADGILSLSAWAEFGTAVSFMLHGDLTPEMGPELLISDQESSIYLLDSALRPLAYARCGPGQFKMGGHEKGAIWHPEPGTSLIFVPGNRYSTGCSFAIVPSPRPPLIDNWWLLALVPAFGVVVAGVRRRTRARIRADLARDNRLRLLEKLQLADHGRIGPLKSLRRLLMLVRAGSRRGAGLDLDRVLGAQADFTRKSLPDLRLTLEIAATAGVADHLLVAARGALDRLGEILSREIDAAGIADLGEELAAVAEEAERSLQNLRAAAEAGFQTDLAAAIERVLAAHADRIAELGVRIERPGLDQPNAVCRVDESELVFVLDNLAENALEAMSGSDARRLTVDWSVGRDRVAVTFADTGCGIDPAAAERIFAPGYSGRGSGGMGLAKSRELLARYRGAIRLIESAPGRGSVFAIEVPGRGA